MKEYEMDVTYNKHGRDRKQVWNIKWYTWMEQTILEALSRSH